MYPAIHSASVPSDEMNKDEEDELLQKLLEKHIREQMRRGVTLEQLAEQIGVRHPTLINIRDGKKGIGDKVRWGFAKVFYNGSVDAMVRAAVGSRETLTVPLAQYPDADLAAEMARREWVPEAAIAEALSTFREKASNWTALDWLEEMRGSARRMKAGGHHVDEAEVDDSSGATRKRRRGK